ncbi:uncharacterized protein isoform X2 [Notothenia coriiceps]|uniref:Uncharacterized protein isoform X2 n=1 Tax=Notothenia coriiceps TaxID=8208 RepID=A0A6I9PND8_9TELE|nr:PREDICTED: uncharacterized protein LOC104962897 isoform X2 [Notothenia coriiceps]
MIHKPKPVKQLPPTKLNNVISPKGRPQTSPPSLLSVIPVLHGSSVDRMDTSDQQPQPKYQKSTEAVNKRKGKLVYQVVVTGTTFDAHFHLMEKVKKEVKDQFDLVQSNSNDYDVTIVFCPIVSRMGPDVESAMRDVRGDKPVILVLMHHEYEVKFIPNVKPLCDGADIQLLVNVFFHETKSGLLYCEENRAAACEIIKKLQECPIIKAQGPAAGSSLTANSRSSSNKTSYNDCCVQ